MKLGGIAGARHPDLKKGDAIQLSPEQKVLAMAKEQVVENSPEGYKRIPVSAEIVGDVQITPGRKLKKDSEPDQFIGTAIVKFRTLKLVDDRLMPTKAIKVKVHCKDCTDDIGAPELQVMDYKVIKEL